MTPKLTTQRQIRRAFWQYVRDVKAQGTSLHLTSRRIPSGNGRMHNTDTRCTFVEWLDAQVKDGQVDPTIAERVTL